MELKRFILKKAFEASEAEEEGHEMGCLISVEFTPAPDGNSIYNTIVENCEKYNIPIEQFYNWVLDCHDRWSHSINPPYEYRELLYVMENYNRDLLL